MRQRIGSGSSTTSFSKELPSPSTPKPAPRSKGTKRVKLEDLSPDDFVKRQRRRERNKIAATKCRNKKKARTVNLIRVLLALLNLLQELMTIFYRKVKH